MRYNFDITRYDVERIMASNTLLPGELARKAKAIESCNEEVSNLNLTDENDQCASDWKMVLYQSAQQEAAAAAAAARSSETGEQKPIGEAAAIFASPLNGLVDVEIENSRQEIDDSGKLASTHVSNSSSLATSLSCSREGSPEKAGFTGFYSKTPNKFISQNSVSSWIQMPVFAAWTDGYSRN
ncbi:hypothetical protein ACMD2_26253 [Ananas comosus]|uniref:Uncharacterized protein n=1 Tax=Ananas comosus TaxID=4615 RepID=A0A199UU85_ANACO|nr:hypothetical protein ACMD2_26253 [Ananas comosus]